MQCIDGYSLLLQRYVREGNNASNSQLLCVSEQTQLNAVHVQLLEKWRLTAFAKNILIFWPKIVQKPCECLSHVYHGSWQIMKIAYVKNYLLGQC